MRRWIVPSSIALSAVPVIASVVRLTELISGAKITPENARFFAAPIPVVVHVVAASIFAVLGAFQFSPSIRRRGPRWHRRAGWVVTACGIVGASSGLWMQATYQLPEDDGALLAAFRVVFGSGMLVSLVLGAVAASQRDFARHGAWMLRGYAIGMGAGTQVLTHAPWVLLLGKPDVLTRALLMGAGWVINLAVAECIIRRTHDRRYSSSEITSSLMIERGA